MAFACEVFYYHDKIIRLDLRKTVINLPEDQQKSDRIPERLKKEGCEVRGNCVSIDLEGRCMIKTKWFMFVGLVAACLLAVVLASAGDSKDDTIPPVPTPGLVTMVDLGAHKCIPCKMMAPVISELKKEYKGRASIIFIDVWEHRDQAQRFGIRGIPTQIFYDREGKEVSRHLGFLNKKGIVATFKKLGVPREIGQ